jgi:hypothetical protein
MPLFETRDVKGALMAAAEGVVGRPLPRKTFQGQ